MRAKQPGRPRDIRGEGTVCTRRGESVSGCRLCAFARFGLDCGAILPRRVAQGGVFFSFFVGGGYVGLLLWKLGRRFGVILMGFGGSLSDPTLRSTRVESGEGRVGCLQVCES